MHELTGFDRGRDGRRGKRHEIQIRTHAFVFQNADPLVHKRHRAPSVTVAAMRPLLRCERLYHCCSWQGEMQTVRTQTDHEHARVTACKGRDGACDETNKGDGIGKGTGPAKQEKPPYEARPLLPFPAGSRAHGDPKANAMSITLANRPTGPQALWGGISPTAPNRPQAAKDAAEDPAARWPIARSRAWPPSRRPWPERPQAW